jgi:tRNA threonylcarbamoyl adenosine modification protein YeaZ
MILAIDTSSAIAVAIVEGVEVMARRAEYAPRSHAELLAGFVSEVIAEAGAEGPDLEGVAVGTGPAPFTGLRVGLVTARVLARTWGIPVWGACSLDALGAEYGATHDGEVTVMADARRREVYWATYINGDRTAGPGVASPLDAARQGPVIGRGAALYADTLGIPVPTMLDPDPVWLAHLVTTRRAKGATDADLSVEPLYLRRPDVHGVPGA